MKKIENRLRFDGVMATSLWPHFFGPPCILLRRAAEALGRAGRSLFDVGRGYLRMSRPAQFQALLNIRVTLLQFSDVLTSSGIENGI